MGRLRSIYYVNDISGCEVYVGGQASFPGLPHYFFVDLQLVLYIKAEERQNKEGTS